MPLVTASLTPFHIDHAICKSSPRNNTRRQQLGITLNRALKVLGNVALKNAVLPIIITTTTNNNTASFCALDDILEIGYRRMLGAFKDGVDLFECFAFCFDPVVGLDLATVSIDSFG